MDYKSKIIKLLDSIEDEKHIRYLYILIKQMISNKKTSQEEWGFPYSFFFVKTKLTIRVTIRTTIRSLSLYILYINNIIIYISFFWFFSFFIRLLIPWQSSQAIPIHLLIISQEQTQICYGMNQVHRLNISW